MANSYQVFVDDNYHYMDEGERYKHGDFATFEEALTACKVIVDEYLQSAYEEGMIRRRTVCALHGIRRRPVYRRRPCAFSVFG